MAIAVTNSIHPELIAPCGMNCAVCSRYLAFINNIPRTKGVTYCVGCRPQDKRCAMLKRDCRKILKLAEGEIDYCCDCDSYPCEKLTHLDKRCREKYGISVLENLEEIRASGLAEFIARQTELYTCRECGGLISANDKKCYKCNRIAGLR